MKKPYIVCHMMASIDGRIDCAMTEQIEGNSYYEALEALTQAIPLADTPERKAYVATLWRGLPQPK